MVIFALIAVLLFAIAGLAVDAGISYLSSDQVERAAAAAALAGVPYLPGDLPDAANTALVEAARNGFTDAGAFVPATGATSCPGSPSPCVMVSQPATNELTVSISVSVPTTFLALIGFGSHTVQRTATAEYLPPIALGQPGNELGSGLNSSCNAIPTSGGPGQYCNPSSGSGGLGSGGNNFYILRYEAWGVDRGQGDGYTPTPNDTTATCAPDNNSGAPTTSCVEPTPDYHDISELYGTETSNCGACSGLNNDGGQNYLVTVPPGQTADVQIYNPSFAPNTDDNADNSVYTLHEDDGDFPDDCTAWTGTTCTATNPDTTQSDYSAAAYSIFSISTLASRLSDTEVSQQIFYPYNASGITTAANLSAASYFYWKNPTGADTKTTVTGLVPIMFHNWVSVVQPSEQINTTSDPNDANDTQLLHSTTQYGTGCTIAQASCYLANTSSVTEYFRLRVDGLSATGQTFSQSTTTGSNAQDQSAGLPLAHKAYAVQVVAPGSVAGATCTGCTVSAMDDLTVYTPVQGGLCQNFEIPMFYLDPGYAGQTISVDLFDVGDVGGGAAYVGLLQPSSLGGTSPTCTTPPSTSPVDQFAQTPSIYDVGTSLSDTSSTYADYAAYPNADNVSGVDTDGNPDDAVIQTAASGSGNPPGGAGAELWNGQWLQFEIQVPSNYGSTLPASCISGSTRTAACYFSLYYSVASGATAGDTFSITAGFNGTPDRLLP